MAISLSTRFIGPDYQSLRSYLSEEEHESLQDLLSVYSPLTGPVRKVVTYFGASGTLPVNVGHSEYYDLDYVLQRVTGIASLDTGARQSLFAGGKGADLYSMFVSSVSETVERILGSLYFFEHGDEHRYGTLRQLRRQGLNCLGPEDIPLFAAEQYDEQDFLYERFTDDSLLGWVAGRRMLSKEEVWVPAQLVELVYSIRSDEALIGYSVSGGLSSHISLEHVLFHGITELIERDAANLRWYCRVPPERIILDREARLPALKRLLDVQRRLPGEIEYYLHSIDVPEIPVITAMEVDPWLDRYAYYSGGGADTDIDTALLKALTEFGQSERTIRLALAAPERGLAYAVRRMFDIGADDPVSKINVFFKVIAYYGYKQNSPRLDWYLHGGNEVNMSSLPPFVNTPIGTKLTDLINRVLIPRSLDPIVFDFTPKHMRQLKLMKVFMPEFTQPFLQSAPMFGHPRFRTTSKYLGASDHDLSYADINKDPLPYP
jgi:ribosomal protein S12 methylthiotransferase accessory factor